MTERRRVVREPRVPTLLKVQVDGDCVQGEWTVKNISRSGMLLLAPAPYPALDRGSSLHVNCEFLYGAGWFQCDTTLVWLRTGFHDCRGEAAMGVGLRFIDLEPSAGQSLELMLSRHRVTILLVGTDKEKGAQISEHLRPTIHLEIASTVSEAEAMLGSREIAVMVCGSDLADGAAVGFLGRCIERYPTLDVANIVLAAGSDRTVFQDLVDADRIFYLTVDPIPVAELVAILHGAVDRYRARSLPQAEAWHLDRYEKMRTARRILEITRRVNMQDDAATAEKLSVDAIKELTNADRAYCLMYDEVNEALWSRVPGGEDRTESAAAGLSSFGVRAVQSTRVDRAGADARYDRDADDPEGEGDERILIEPVVDTSQRALAVLVAVRKGYREQFDQDECEAMSLLAGQLAGAFSRLGLQTQIDEVTDSQLREGRAQRPKVFRDEALKYHASPSIDGHALDLSPGWINSVYRFVLVVGFLSLVFTSAARVHEYASGPAIVRVEEDSEPSILALVPGEFRPQLRPGDSLRFEVSGYPHAYQMLAVTQLGEEVIGPSDITGLLGSEAAGAMTSVGRVVVVRARLPKRTFASDGQEYQYYDGMLGKVEIELRSEPLVRTLLPGL